MDTITPHFIHGEAYVEASESFRPIMNPAEGQQIGQVPMASELTCLKALTTAESAYATWSRTTPMQRSKILFEFRAILQERKQMLAAIITREHGKTLEDAAGSVSRGIELVEWYCGLVSHWQTTLTNQAATDIDCYTFYQPLGVCVGVSPFNFPVMVPLWMMIPAIACGNTFILKPSEQDPSPVICLAEWLTEAGLPPGVVTVVHGCKETVDYLVTHPIVQAVTAVASTTVAEQIYQQAVRLNKRAHTFGGAKNHALVMSDANMKEAAKAIVGAAYGSAGERCMALSVVVTVGEKAATDLLTELVPLVQAIRVGPGDMEGVDMGPLISKVHHSRVREAVEQGIKEGAKLLVDGRHFKHVTHPKGYFLGPCLFDEVTPTMGVYQQEIFGPVLVVVRAQTFDEALDMINAHPYGNGTAIFTRSGETARTYVKQVNAGMVGVNVPIPVPIVSHPFGGWKRSSFGDIPMHGEHSMRFYTKQKTVTSRWPEQVNGDSAFVMPT